MSCKASVGRLPDVPTGGVEITEKPFFGNFAKTHAESFFALIFFSLSERRAFAPSQRHCLHRTEKTFPSPVSEPDANQRTASVFFGKSSGASCDFSMVYPTHGGCYGEPWSYWDHLAHSRSWRGRQYSHFYSRLRDLARTPTVSTLRSTGHGLDYEQEWFPLPVSREFH